VCEPERGGGKGANGHGTAVTVPGTPSNRSENGEGKSIVSRSSHGKAGGHGPGERRYRFFNGMMSDLRHRMPLYLWVPFTILAGKIDGYVRGLQVRLQGRTQRPVFHLGRLHVRFMADGLLAGTNIWDCRFFASFAPAITFGGLMGKYTNEKMGTIETLFAQCICGVIWGSGGKRLSRFIHPTNLIWLQACSQRSRC